ncbi:MAG TPA: 3-deoxy-7-phosphoheptulonate synthase [Polyangiaceae bacterium]|jgi:3-deoxy-7-phosphoheptulonate synthase|nr:3-deoxy-7-phosphoheptulonate synthase [Polyangiaceae bacterium]
MLETKDLRIVDTTLLKSPNEVTSELPLSERAASVVFAARQEIQALLHGEDSRPLAIVGPCSIHDPEAALDYARRLLELKQRFAHEILLIMRVYFEKPRTTVGWKGLINDPHLDGSYDIPTGIRAARRLLLNLAELGMPAATEMLDPIIPQYIADLVSWTAIGARTTESQTHREMASGLSMPVGFKNGTDGGLGVAMNAMIAASRSHSFLGIDPSGHVGVVRTRGNPHTHLVLRGGSMGPNYSPAQVSAAVLALENAQINPRVLIDCSHDNSGKNHLEQPAVLAEIGAQIRGGSQAVLGAMIESNIAGGKQELGSDKSKLVYGQSITDACVDFATTERMLEQFASDAARRNPTRATA